MSARVTPTARSLAWLRERGYIAEVVEYRIPRTNISRDLWGFIDILAIKPGEPPLGVQVTSGSNVAARVRKIAEHPNTPIVRECGIRIHVHGWRNLKATGWTLRELDLS